MEQTLAGDFEFLQTFPNRLYLETNSNSYKKIKKKSWKQFIFKIFIFEITLFFLKNQIEKIDFLKKNFDFRKISF